jgi:hypothetical protein
MINDLLTRIVEVVEPGRVDHEILRYLNPHRQAATLNCISEEKRMQIIPYLSRKRKGEICKMLDHWQHLELFGWDMKHMPVLVMTA